MRIGFIGLGNVGGKLAGSLLRNGFDLTVRDLDRDVAQPFLDKGAKWADSPREMAEAVDFVITCLPNPAASAAVMEAGDGVLVEDKLPLGCARALNQTIAKTTRDGLDALVDFPVVDQRPVRVVPAQPAGVRARG